MAPPPPQRAAASQLLRAGPPASASTGTQCLRFPPLARSLSQPLEAYDPGSTLSTLAFSRSMQEPQTRITPPLRRTPPGQKRGHPPGSSRGATKDPRFRCHLTLFDASTAHARPGCPGPSASGTSSWSPPDASNAPSPRSLTTTVFSQRSTGWFRAFPRRTTLEGQQASISSTAPPMKMPPT